MVLSSQYDLALIQRALWIGIVQINPSDLIRLYELMELRSALEFVRSVFGAAPAPAPVDKPTQIATRRRDDASSALTAATSGR